MKKFYEEPSIEVEKIVVEDIITESNYWGDDELDERD